MAIITTNGSFGATAAVTSTTLNAVADAATFSDPVDGTSLELKVDGKLGIKDAGVTTAKVLDANVTVAKIGGITDSLKVIGRTTAGAGAAEEVTINDNDDLSGASAITLATDESIKAYVDTSKTSAFIPSTYAGGESVTLPNGLIMKFGTATSNSDSAQSFTFSNIGSSAFPADCINVTTGGISSTALSDVSSTGFTLNRLDSLGGQIIFYWQAIGY